MNATSRICNQSVIQYNSRPEIRNSLTEGSVSVQRKTNWKASTRNWVFDSFYRNKPQGAEKTSSSAGRNCNDSGEAQSNRRKKIQGRAPSASVTKSAVQFDEYLIELTAKKFKFCLVGKFPGSRPSLEQIRRWASKEWVLEGECSITLLNHSHVFIRLHNKNDMIHVWGQSRCFVHGNLMKIFRWTPSFRPSDEEPSVAAVWILLPSLPVVYFEEDLLYRVVSPIGEYLCMDGPTKDLTRTHFARLCVVVDLLKDLPRTIWVGVGHGGFSQDVSYEKLPLYCSCCLQYGHSTSSCKSNIPSTSGASTQASNAPDEHLHSEITCVPPNELFPENDPSRSLDGALAGTHNMSRSSLDQQSGKKQSRQEHEPCLVRNESKGPIDQDCELGNSKDLPGADEMISNEIAAEEDAAFGENVASKSFDGSGTRCLCRIFFWRKTLKKRQALELVSDSSTADATSKVISENLKLEKRSEIKKLRVQERMQSCRTLTLWKSVADEVRPSVLHRYKYKEIVKMTASFSNIIGRGGSSTVYKGELPDQRTVAVKVYARRMPKAEHWFRSEIQVAGAASHDNVLKLFGFCCEGSSMALVLEYAPNRSLDILIHSHGPSNHSLGWEQQYQIALGVAKGIDYLHSVCDILHGDVKPGNVLLDENFCPKICDFGLATRMEEESSFSLSAARGTLGYIAPELVSLRVSRKLDVYGYGVTLLEMLTRRRPFGGSRTNGMFTQKIVDFAHDYLNQQNNVRLGGEEEFTRMMIKVGLWCTQSKPEDRPSMTQVLDMLHYAKKTVLCTLQGECDGIRTPPPPSMSEELEVPSDYGSIGSIGSVDLLR